MPLILPSQTVIRPNPLAYPAGATPGIDRSHPAARNCYLSAVPSGGPNYVNLITGATLINTVPAQTTGTATAMHGIVGPGITFTDTAPSLGIDLTGANKSFASFTAAAIFVAPTADPNFATLVGVRNSAGNTTNAFYLNASNNFILAFPATVNSGFTVTAEQSYFAAISTDAVSGDPVYFVLKNLTTGMVLSSSVVQSQQTGFSARYIFIGCDNGSLTAGGIAKPLAAAMFAETALSPSQLLAWSADPWAFWYPRRTIQYTTPATTTSGGARIRQRWNRSVLAYPAGAVPGVDRSHPAARGAFYTSAVSTNGGNFINLVSGKPFIGSSATTVVEALGSTSYITSGSPVTTPGLGALPTAAIFAAIFRPVVISGDQGIVLYTDGAGNRGLYLIGGGSVNSQGNGGTDTSSGITLVAGVPYFVAFSDPFDTGLNINFVVKNLRTGQLQTAIVTSAGAPGRADTTIQIGSDIGTSAPSNSHIAAAMYSPNLYLSLQQLLQWSADPWAFWYPNNFKEFATAGITPPPPTIVPARTMMGVGV